MPTKTPYETGKMFGALFVKKSTKAQIRAFWNDSGDVPLDYLYEQLGDFALEKALGDAYKNRYADGECFLAALHAYEHGFFDGVGRKS